jgi:hypothetical protein
VAGLPTEPAIRRAPIARRAGTTVPGVLRWLCASVVGLVLTGFTVLLLTGHYREEGPVLVTVTADHGLHSGDLLVIAGWAVSIVALVVLAAPRRTRTSRTDRF